MPTSPRACGHLDLGKMSTQLARWMLSQRANCIASDYGKLTRNTPASAWKLLTA